MLITRLLITFFISIMCLALSAKTMEADSVKADIGKSIEELPELSLEYYADVNSMSRSYDYELENRKKMLRMRANEVLVLGGITALAINVCGIALSENKKYSLWITVPGTIAATMVPMYFFAKWSENLRRKADAIDVSTAYILPINDYVTIGVSQFKNKNEYKYNTMGFGIKAIF